MSSEESKGESAVRITGLAAVGGVDASPVSGTLRSRGTILTRHPHTHTRARTHARKHLAALGSTWKHRRDN